MSRPEHLSCVNSAEGIRRINQEQELYDKDPQAYEQRELEHRQEMERQQELMMEEQMQQEQNEQNSMHMHIQ